jgi:hypothetical protein
VGSSSHRRTVSGDVQGIAGRGSAGESSVNISQQGGRRASSELPGGASGHAGRSRTSVSGGGINNAGSNVATAVVLGSEGSRRDSSSPHEKNLPAGTGEGQVLSTGNNSISTAAGGGVKGISTTVRLLVDLLPQLSDAELAAAQGGVCAGCKGPLPEVPSPSAAAAAAWLTLSSTQSKGPRR